LALGHTNLGDLLRGLGKPTDAWEQYHQALTQLSHPSSDNPLFFRTARLFQSLCFSKKAFSPRS